MRARRPPALALVLGLCAAGGCSTASIDLNYAPSSATQKLSVPRMPNLYLAEIEDRTASGQPIYAGIGGTPSGVLTRPLAESVSAAVRAEFAALGVPLAASRAQADAVFKAAITAAGASLPIYVYQRGGANVPIDAKVGLALELRSLAGDLLWSGEADGKGSRFVLAPGYPGSAPSDAMNDALADAMRRVGAALGDEGVLDRVFRGVEPAAGKSATVARAPAPAAAPRSDVDELPPAGPRHPHSYAVVIGVERYREKLPSAEFAVGDATLVAQYLERSLGVPEENVAILTDDRATKSDFEKYLERWLPNRVEAGDTVYVYYSGHGAPNPSKGDAYLVPYDADPTYIDQTGFAVERLFGDLAKLPAKQVYVAMDSCFSGAGGRSVVAKGARPLVTVRSGDVPANVAVLSASAANQISNSYGAKGHGLFTYYFLKGLKEKGPDLRAVFDYLKPEVARAARREYNADQEPQWRSGQ